MPIITTWHPWSVHSQSTLHLLFGLLKCIWGREEMSKNCPKAHLCEHSVTIQTVREIDDYSPSVADDMIGDQGQVSQCIHFIETAETYIRAREERH